MPTDSAAKTEIADFFAALDEPRRPWIDLDSLKRKFLALSAAVHPDRIHGAPEAERQAANRRFSEMNAAYQCLREPKERLRHLLELETGRKPSDIERIPPAMTDSFFEIGKLIKDTDAFLSARQNAASPVLKAQQFERGLEWTDKLQAMQAKINSRREELATELKTMNASWESAEGTENRSRLPLARLEEIYRMSGYFNRWSAQLQERIVQLAV
jgi:curved DNA-binding protein CbpA